MERGPAGEPCAEILLLSITVTLSDSTVLCVISKPNNICSFVWPSPGHFAKQGLWSSTSDNPGDWIWTWTSEAGLRPHGGSGLNSVGLSGALMTCGRACGPRSKKSRQEGTDPQCLGAPSFSWPLFKMESLPHCSLYGHHFPPGIRGTRTSMSWIVRVCKGLHVAKMCSKNF